jgi:amidohydrolase
MMINKRQEISGMPCTGEGFMKIFFSHQKKIFLAIEKSEDKISRLGDEIYRHPETGFREYNTARRVEDAFAHLEFEQTRLPDLPAVKYTLNTGRPGPELALVGELDALTCPEHPDADPETGAVHACGHNIQIASLFGAALGLLAEDIQDALCGKVHFIAVPAEEYIEIEYRRNLIKQGRLTYLGGKAELVKRGWFDNVDLCLMTHVMTAGSFKIAFQSFNGCMVKMVHFMGRSAHAGSAPHEGVNALYAAHTALTAVNAIRETFQDSDHIRVHPIITKGGSAVNVIPDDVRIETFIRGQSMQAIKKAGFQFDQAMAAGALALGATVEIDELPGAFPFFNDKGLVHTAKEVLSHLLEEHEIADMGHTTASTDAGELAALMPVIQPLIGCISGGLHEASYRLVDRHLAYRTTSQLLAGMTYDLLVDEAAAARQIIQAYQPACRTKEDYLKHLDNSFRKRRFPDENARGWPYSQ